MLATVKLHQAGRCRVKAAGVQHFEESAVHGERTLLHKEKARQVEAAAAAATAGRPSAAARRWRQQQQQQHGMGNS
jgi:hypothetical protein